MLANVVTLDVCVGADLFLRETFNGNGRSCGTCHPVANNFTIDPAFIATLPAGNPLFIAEFNPTLAKLEVPAQMRARSLILENVDGLQAPTTKFVLRSVPHNFSMGTSIASPDGATVIPVERTGWSGDGAPNNGSLRQFQQGAITQHYPKSLNRVNGVDFRLATAGELDRIDLFMKRLGRTNELDLPNTLMSDAGAEAGRQAFIAVGCDACHGNAGAIVNIPGLTNNFNFNTGVESARATGVAGFPIDGGLGVGPLAGGGFGNGTFNVPPLVEAADTGPFFHTATRVSGASAHNAAEANTIEQAVAFYDTLAFNNSPDGQLGPINIDATQINNIARFLRVINASFNIHLAISRAIAANALTNGFGNNHLAMQREMARLSQVEAEDALQVLTGQANLNLAAQDQIRIARTALGNARTTTSAVGRIRFLVDARDALIQANELLGKGLDFLIADGTNMF